LFALGVMVLGICGAWPYRHTPQPASTPRERPATLSLTLRQPDAPLELEPRMETSPAVGLADARPPAVDRREGESAAALAAVSPRTVTDLAIPSSPPALPVSFQPSAAGAAPSDWRPDPVARPQAPRGKPRPYRLRDGDTLESIAGRLLGDANRAAEVFEMNRGVLTRPDLLPVGVTILLPPRENPAELEPVNAGPRP
jgi:nucleoid-associated protein YgaU